MSYHRILFLSGGTGTPKLLQGIKNLVNLKDITIIGNTGDDWIFYGLHVSPDIDSILFTLTDLIDEKKWWGIEGDSFNIVNFLQDKLKEDIWFNLGDFDTALCLFRSYLLNQGKNLTETTDILRKRLGLECQILPMANQIIQTQVRTTSETMHLQEFWVKHKGKPEVLDIFFKGDLRKTTPEVLNAIDKADIVIIGPSNPISSIEPILALFPLRHALQKASAYRIAISPIIGTNAISGPAGKFLNSWGKKVSPLSVIELFNDILDAFMINKSDLELQSSIQKMGITPILEDIYINTELDANRILRKIMDSQ